MVYTFSGHMVYTPFACFHKAMVDAIALLLCDVGVGRQTEKGLVPLWRCMLFIPDLRQ